MTTRNPGQNPIEIFLQWHKRYLKPSQLGIVQLHHHQLFTKQKIILVHIDSTETCFSGV